MSVPMLEPSVARKSLRNAGSRSGSSWEVKVLTEFPT
jgi:hypothetical protein